jgi:hypothetical protein
MDTSKQPGVTNSAEVVGTEVEASDERSRTSISEKFASSEKQNLDQSTQVTTEVVSPASARKGGGPRTTQGKQRSKLNALKLGIFSQVVLLKGESRAEIDSLLRGLRKDFQPSGTLENVKVVELAAILLRKSRLHVAEVAEIRMGTEFLELDEKRHLHDQMSGITTVDVQCGGLVPKIANPEVLDKCLELLQKLSSGIEKNGFEEKHDKAILTRLYGDPEWTFRASNTLLDFYSAFLSLIRSSASDGKQSELARREQYKNHFLAKLIEEVEQLCRYKREHALTESNRREVELLRRKVPDTPQLDRLLRYEAHLERSFDRTPNQLERLQRIRKGQPVPPTLNVNLST